MSSQHRTTTGTSNRLLNGGGSSSSSSSSSARTQSQISSTSKSFVSKSSLNHNMDGMTTEGVVVVVGTGGGGGGVSSSSTTSNNNNNNNNNSSSSSSSSSNNKTLSSSTTAPTTTTTTAPTTTTAAITTTAATTSSTQQHQPKPSSSSLYYYSKYNPSGRIVSLCIQNILHMGSRTYGLLCPPSIQCRFQLLQQLHLRMTIQQQQLQNMSTITTTTGTLNTSSNTSSSNSNNNNSSTLPPTTTTAMMTSSSNHNNHSSSKSLLGRSSHHHHHRRSRTASSILTSSSPSPSSSSSSSIIMAATTNVTILVDPHRTYFQLSAMIGSERLEEYEVLEEEYLLQNTTSTGSTTSSTNTSTTTNQNKKKKNNNNNNTMTMMMMMMEQNDDDDDDDNDPNNVSNEDNDDEDEVASSGDEDELVDIHFMFSDEPIPLDDNIVDNHNNNNTTTNTNTTTTSSVYNHHPEPLYPSVSSSSTTTTTTTDHNNNNNNNNNNGMNHNNSNNNNNNITKLPFQRRKLPYFDQITTNDIILVRNYLKREYQFCKQRIQQELCHTIIQKVIPNNNKNNNNNTTTTTTTAPTTTTTTSMEQQPGTNEKKTNTTTTTTISLFDHPMTPAIAAALLLESLCLNPYESIEGMAKCYDGIVAAGVALLDMNTTTNPTSSLIDPTNNNNNSNNNSTSSSHQQQQQQHRMNTTTTRRSEIMAALAPLLITSLEPPSGDVILLLAQLRRRCGTVRYRRRLVQRIAPALIRPPHCAMWCVQHQNDMMAIFAATELIFDAAFDVFSKGWYERGRWLLADSQRAETLSVAAKQLQNLSQEPIDSCAFSTQRNSNNLRHNHHHHRRLKNDQHHHHHHHLDEPLAEWEVIAVDRQIRISISSVFHTDWTRAAIHETVPRPNTTTQRQRALSTSGASSSTNNNTTTNNNNNNPRRGSPATTTNMAMITTDMSPRTPRGTSSFGKAPASPLSESSMISSSTEPPPFGMPLTTTPVSTSNNNNNYYNNERSQTPPPSTPFTNNNNSNSNNNPTGGGSENELSPRQQQYQSLIQQLPRSPKSHERNMELSPRHMISKDLVTGNIQINTGGSSSITPLSPSASSVGSAPENVNVFQQQQQQHKPNTVGSMTLTSATGPSTAHYRMLTSTAAERKRTVAACRALRAQIQRFEDAFVQLHGRPPKGAGDRAPLATTYAQYREWKRAIRADAACRIQALFRGSRCRWALLRNNSNNAIITRIVRTRAGRSNSALLSSSSATTTMIPVTDYTATATSTNAINDTITIPFEIEDLDPMTSPESIKSGNVVASLSPQWANQLAAPRLNFGESPNDGVNNSSNNINNNNSTAGNNNNATSTLSNPRSQVHSGNSSPSSSPTDQSPDSTLINMSFADLQARKRDLKQQLKQYDMNFARKHGRMPVKSEKEPIRHLYESYNTLKSQITELERDGKHLPSSTGSTLMLSGSNPPPQLLQPLPLQRQISPTSGSDTDDSSPVAMKVGAASPVGSVVRSKRKLPKPGTTAPPMNTGSSGTTNSTSSSSGVGASSSGSAVIGQHDLTALKAEKQNLHTMLRSFEKDFFRENRRQVSSFADIRPVASQYRRYKEIKKQIASLQQQSSSSSSER